MGRPGHGWEGNIITDLNQTGRGARTEFVWHRKEKMPAVVNTAMNILFQKKKRYGIFLTS